MSGEILLCGVVVIFEPELTVLCYVVLKRRYIIFSIIFEMEFSKLMGRKFSFLLKLFPAFGMRKTIAVLY
jgi:hypothetical protein